VMPKMAEFMNVDTYYNPFEKTEERIDSAEVRVTPADLYPYEKWEKIYNYYLRSAPENPVQAENHLSPVQEGLPGFAIHELSGKYLNPLTTYVEIDSSRGGFYFADGNAGVLYRYDNDLVAIDSVFGDKGIVAAAHSEDRMKILSMGVLSPSDKKLGKYTEVRFNNLTSHTIIDSLDRPVHVSAADLNRDHREDLVICEFGFRYGMLGWYENKGEGVYIKHILRDLPGAVRTEVADFDHDGDPDILALMAQGDEGLFIYYNDGDGNFREKKIAGFPPVYGSNYFALFDFDGDGDTDILTTNGDNADYSFSLKSYHGIRIFINNGNNQFEEKIFLPVNGVQKAIPGDFDNDGDIDLVSISYFPDYDKKPEESFIYWQNKGDNQYKRFTFGESFRGRWMVMDAADIDHDGDLDIALGSAVFSFGEVPQRFKNTWNKKRISVLILENKLID